jgi:hypothetical protein
MRVRNDINDWDFVVVHSLFQYTLALVTCVRRRWRKKSESIMSGTMVSLPLLMAPVMTLASLPMAAAKFKDEQDEEEHVDDKQGLRKTTIISVVYIPSKNDNKSIKYSN